MWIPQRTLLLILTLPPMAAKVEPQMAQARRDIDKKLIPSGPQVVRYLSLPSEGQTKDWILSEMDRMDSYCHNFDDRGTKLHDWKDGKISGAVYRESVYFQAVGPGIECMGRWWTRPDEHNRRRLRTLLRF
jgi:sphinganine-1-phosphate aldolase